MIGKKNNNYKNKKNIFKKIKLNFCSVEKYFLFINFFNNK